MVQKRTVGCRAGVRASRRRRRSAYVDDGSVSLEDSKQFSVHTGCTEFVPVIAATGTSVEGVAPLVDDLKRGRRTALALIGASMTVLAILVLFAF